MLSFTSFKSRGRIEIKSHQEKGRNKERHEQTNAVLQFFEHLYLVNFNIIFSDG